MINLAKYFPLIAAMFAIMIMANEGLAQSAPAGVAQKVVIVDTSAFFKEKTGITKIVAASQTVATELAPRRAEVNGLVARVENLNKEIATLQQNNTSGIPVDQRAAQAKMEELDRLKREGKFKQDDFNAYVEKRQQQVIGPVYADVMKVLNEYVKSMNFGMVFDVSKDQSGFLMYATDQYDITKDFIAFYNSRPTTTIAPVPSK